VAHDFLHTTLGRTGWPVFRIGFSASYRPRPETVTAALERGVNFFFGFGFDAQLRQGLREAFPRNRDKIYLATGAYNYIWGHGNLRRSLEKRLRQFGTEYIDVFMFMGIMKPGEFPRPVLDEMLRLKQEGKVRAIGVSIHDRKFAGRLAEAGELDVLMIRYNAAHRGAEREIFPFLARHNPGLVSYTATRWTALTRRPRGWPENKPLPPPASSYRFALTHPAVHVCLMAPRSLREFEENIRQIETGPLSDQEADAMREFGDVVYHRKRWFM
jgi:aryl-alcohol dehydrogenase-like predicted oxidoreductase